MKDKTNEELLKELENALIWMCIKEEHNQHKDADRLQGKVDRLKEEILNRMK